jgi:hypothetical protein
MTLRAWLVLAGTLAAGLAASVLSAGRSAPLHDPVAIEVDGIGPLRLGANYQASTIAARRAAPESAMAGAGCTGRDEITYSGQLGDLPVSVMAMADDGVITEVEMTLDAPRSAVNEAECLAVRGQLAQHFMARFGPVQEELVIRKPVSSEHLLDIGPAILNARWFATGRSCYITASYTIDPRG